MAGYGITAKDLQAKVKGKPGRKAKDANANANANAKAPKTKKEKSAVAPKYKGPNGETWTGRGLTPKWLASLVEAGQPKEAFLIKESAPV